MNRIKGEEMTNKEKLISDIKNENGEELKEVIRCPQTHLHEVHYCLNHDCKDCIKEWLNETCY